jgi:hypothetical protein
MAEQRIEQAPVPDLAGSFAIYTLPDGSVAMVARIAGEDGERRGLVPPAIAAAARTLLEGGEVTPRAFWKAMRSARGGQPGAVPS